MKLKVDVITPEKRTLTDEVDFIAAPAYDGEIGILPGHTPLLTRLGMGSLRFKKGDDTAILAISGGFLEVAEGNQVSIYATTAEIMGEINIERARQAAERAKGELMAARAKLTQEELAKIMASLSRAEMRLKVAKLKRKHPNGDGH